MMLEDLRHAALLNCHSMTPLSEVAKYLYLCRCGYLRLSGHRDRRAVRSLDLCRRLLSFPAGSF